MTSTSVHYHASSFPPREIKWPQLIPLLGTTAAAVARYDGILAAVPNPAVLLSPLTTQEAVLSSRIEGTQATFDEVLEYEAAGEGEGVPPERVADIHEVLNYRRALREAERMMAELPLCLRVVCAAHRLLMDGVRGHGKGPGELRRVANWIGPPGCPIAEARFVPISAGDLPAAMTQWERYANEEAADRLVQLAILHAEFEALHPFLDGNGRLGRMLVPLFLWQARLIRAPMFYLSAYLEARRDEYYERLLAVSRDGDWTGWCGFFLEATRQQAEANLEKARGILDLYASMKPRLHELTRSQYVVHALDWMFERPIFRSSDFVGGAGIPKPTATRILRVLRESGDLRAISPARGRRPAILAFSALLNVAEGRDAF
ncbi:MAG: Fic family protein [Thermoanaerobaculia bacterium]